MILDTNYREDGSVEIDGLNIHRVVIWRQCIWKLCRQGLLDGGERKMMEMARHRVENLYGVFPTSVFSYAYDKLKRETCISIFIVIIGKPRINKFCAGLTKAFTLGLNVCLHCGPNSFTLFLTYSGQSHYLLIQSSLCRKHIQRQLERGSLGKTFDMYRSLSSLSCHSSGSQNTRTTRFKASTFKGGARIFFQWGIQRNIYQKIIIYSSLGNMSKSKF